MSDKELTTVNEDEVENKTTDTTEAENAKPVPPPDSAEIKPRSNSVSKITYVLLIIVLAAAGAGYYFWMQFSNTIQSLQRTSVANEQQISSQKTTIEQQSNQLEAHTTAITELLNELNKANATIKTLQEQQKTITATTQRIYDITHRDQRQWLLAEVSYLLSLANQRLVITSDVTGSIAALNGANNRLHDLADPSLLAARKQIALEISALKSVKIPDINGLTLQLDNMLENIQTLSFKTPQQQTQQIQQNDNPIQLASLDQQSFFYNIWERIKSLVTIKRHDEAIKNAVEAANQQEIEQDIQYRLMAARQAVLQLNTALLQRETGAALQKLSFYYDETDSRVQQIIRDLTDISNTELSPEYPDISKSWQMIQKAVNESAIHDLQIETKKTR